MRSNRLRRIVYAQGLFSATVLAILLGGLPALQPAAAQKRMEDPRPVRGLDRQAIPTYSSVQEFMAAHPMAALRSAGTVVGHVPKRVRSLAPPHPAGAGARADGFADVRITRAANGTVRWMTGDVAAAAREAGSRKGIDLPVVASNKAFSAEAFEEAAVRTARAFADILALSDPERELRPVATTADELGYVHARFEQVYNGIPVWGRDLYVHFDREGVPYALNGTYEPTPAGVATAPRIAVDAARSLVESDLKAKGRWAPVPDATAQWLGLTADEPRLVLYPDAGEMRLAYEVSIHPNLIERYSYLVDARSFEIIHVISRHCSVLPADGTLPPPDGGALRVPTVITNTTASAGTFLEAAGVALDGFGRNFRVYRHDDGTHHMIWDIQNLDPNAFQFPQFGTGGILTFTADHTDGNQDGQITTVVSADNTWSDPAAVSAHENARILYDYYRTTFNRSAIDGKDASILSVVHITSGGEPMDNAYWNGRFMAYGDGAQAFMPLAGAVDVAAHEMTHGVVEHSAGLVYQFQPGALNESFADVFGVMLDRDDLLVGEDITRPEFGPALRDMLHPDNPQLRQPQPAHMSAYQNLSIDQDNGGVHINSGIPNRAAALLIQAIGHDKVQEIYYRALTSYLTRNSQFGDARNAVEQAASDLHGAGSAEVAAVQRAFDAVGISATTGTGAEGGNDLPPATGGASLITFLLQDGSIGVVDLTNPNDIQVGVFEDPPARARANLDAFAFAQLTTPRSGERIWFVNQNGLLAHVDVQTGAVSVFNGLQIGQPGDLWNASISPDESYVALVSAYENDPTLYVFNGQEVGAIALMPETTQEGILTQTIRFPDVVSWSPNPQIPRIAFDAFNEVDLQTGPLGFWGIYEIDFAADRIYNMMPAQPTGYSVGNIAYSNTDPDVIAFNAIDPNGTFDVVVADYARGVIYPFELPSLTFDGGARLLDAQRPTFSPDDAILAFTSPQYGVLGFVELASEDLSFLNMDVPVFNPHWFTLGGAGGAQNQAPAAAFTLDATAGTAPLTVTADASGSSDPDGQALTYRWEFGDGTIGSGVSATHTFQQTGIFTVTLTVTDPGGLSGTATRQVNVSASGVSADAGAELPRAVALHPNHPNPFNPATVVRFDLPGAMDAEITVYDTLGRLVRRLLSRPMQAGTHEIRFEAGNLPSGAYLARLRAGDVVQTRTMLLLR